MPSFNVSKLLGGVSGPTGPSRSVSQIISTRKPANGFVRGQFVKDFSGSVLQYVEDIAAAERKFVQRVLADPILRERLLLAATEMSGVVESSPYMSAAEYKPPGLQAGGFSPHATMLRSALEADARHAAPVAATVHVVVCDGWVSGETLDVDEVVREYRAAQERDPDLHVFVVEIGAAYEDFTRNLSIRHEAIGRQDAGKAFTAAADAIFSLLHDAVRAPSGEVSAAINRSKSLDRLHGREVDSGL